MIALVEYAPFVVGMIGLSCGLLAAVIVAAQIIRGTDEDDR